MFKKLDTQKLLLLKSISAIIVSLILLIISVVIVLSKSKAWFSKNKDVSYDNFLISSNDSDYFNVDIQQLDNFSFIPNMEKQVKITIYVLQNCKVGIYWGKILDNSVEVTDRVLTAKQKDTLIEIDNTQNNAIWEQDLVANETIEIYLVVKYVETGEEQIKQEFDTIEFRVKRI